MPLEPLSTCRPRAFHAPNPATAVASGRCAAISSTLLRKCGQLHRMHDSGSLHSLWPRGISASWPIVAVTVVPRMCLRDRGSRRYAYIE